MKKIVPALFFICMTPVLSAQYNFTSSWPSKSRIGFEGGPGLISLYGNTTTEKTETGTLGYSGGIFYQYSFTPMVHPDSTGKSTFHSGLKTGVYLDRKGDVVTPTSLANGGMPVGNTTTHRNFDYITIPVLFQFMMGRNNRVKVYETFGPYVGVLVNQSTITSKPDTASIVQNDKNKYTEIDIGLCMGVGLEIPIRQQYYLHAEFRQNLGLYDINRSAIASDLSIHTSSPYLVIGFSYRFKKKKAPKVKEK